MKHYLHLILTTVAVAFLAGCASIRAAHHPVAVVGPVDLSPVAGQPANRDSLGYLLENAGCKLEQRKGHYVIHRSPAATQTLITLLHTLDARMKVVAENIANVNTTRAAAGRPYRRRILEIDDSGQAGRIIGDVAPYRTQHLPGHPDADGEGDVLYPNVNLHLEMAELVKIQTAKNTLAKILRRLDPDVVVAGQ